MPGQTFAVESAKLAPGLYLVATPIGNLGDITLRALSTLMSADAIACEDTRMTAKLLSHYGIQTPTRSYHEHNAQRERPKLIAAMQAGQTIALVSDAGTPLISDPGFKLVREAQDAGITVTSLPGASSVPVALSVSGLPTDRFLFAGFLPSKASAIRTLIAELANISATLVFFESANRLPESLMVLAEMLGNREASVARELTKRFEEIRRASLPILAEHYAASGAPRGEVVLLIGPPQANAYEETGDDPIDAALTKALARTSLKAAVAEVSATLNLARNRVYQRALLLKEGKP